MQAAYSMVESGPAWTLPDVGQRIAPSTLVTLLNGIHHDCRCSRVIQDDLTPGMCRFRAIDATMRDVAGGCRVARAAPMPGLKAALCPWSCRRSQLERGSGPHSARLSQAEST